VVAVPRLQPGPRRRRGAEPPAGAWRTWVLHSAGSIAVPAPPRAGSAAARADLDALRRRQRAHDDRRPSPTGCRAAVADGAVDGRQLQARRNPRRVTSRPGRRPGRPSYPSEHAAIERAAVRGARLPVSRVPPARLSEMAQRLARERLLAGLNFPQRHARGWPSGPPSAMRSSPTPGAIGRTAIRLAGLPLPGSRGRRREAPPHAEAAQGSVVLGRGAIGGGGGRHGLPARRHRGAARRDRIAALVVARARTDGADG
jgi:hypothetical protein